MTIINCDFARGYAQEYEVFADLTIWQGIRRVIEQVNANALAA